LEYVTGDRLLQAFGKTSKEFNDDISRWDMSNVKNFKHMFNAALSFNQPIGGWGVSNVKDI